MNTGSITSSCGDPAQVTAIKSTRISFEDSTGPASTLVTVAGFRNTDLQAKLTLIVVIFENHFVAPALPTDLLSKQTARPPPSRW